MTPRTLACAAVAAALIFAGCGGDSEVLGTSATTETSERSDQARTVDTRDDDKDTSTTTTTAQARPEPMTFESGFTTSVDSIGTRYVDAGALVTNPNADHAGYDVRVVFNLMSADGRILDTDTADVPYIPSGATVPVAPLQIGFDIDEEPVGVEVTATGDFERDKGWDGVEWSMYEGVDLEVSDPRFRGDEWGDSIEFTVRNPSDEVLESGSYMCVLRREGAVVGGATSGFYDPVAPGGSIRVSTSVGADGAAADEVICRAWG